MFTTQLCPWLPKHSEPPWTVGMAKAFQGIGKLSSAETGSQFLQGHDIFVLADALLGGQSHGVIWAHAQPREVLETGTFHAVP